MERKVQEQIRGSTVLCTVNTVSQLTFILSEHQKISISSTLEDKTFTYITYYSIILSETSYSRHSWKSKNVELRCE